jgi:hypothetical protein
MLLNSGRACCIACVDSGGGLTHPLHPCSASFLPQWGYKRGVAEKRHDQALKLPDLSDREQLDRSKYTS